MPLMPFTIPEHVPLLLDSRKVQTTRQPRKKPLKVGDILYCYHKPRQKKSCKNCLLKKEYGRGNCDVGDGRFGYCSDWSNYFGEATIIKIEHYYHKNLWKKDEGDEYYFVRFGELCQDREGRAIVEEWARKDGFANLDEAQKWFSKSDINKKWQKVSWMCMDWDVITFKPSWVKRK